MQNLQHNYSWLLPIIIFEAILKSIALWKAARNKQLYWYIALLILNTAGIVPLIYIFIFQKDKNSK